MIDGIRQNLSYLEPGARKGSKAETPASAPARAGLSAAAAIGAEVVEISASGPGPQGAPLDKAKIDAIRTAIRNNAYPIDYDKLADQMIAQLRGGGSEE
jgi:anti-sigma28 factor (negative regulator of flagellin synthesis)